MNPKTAALLLRIFTYLGIGIGGLAVIGGPIFGWVMRAITDPQDPYPWISFVVPYGIYALGALGAFIAHLVSVVDNAKRIERSY